MSKLSRGRPARVVPAAAFMIPPNRTLSLMWRAPAFMHALMCWATGLVIVEVKDKASKRVLDYVIEPYERAAARMAAHE